MALSFSFLLQLVLVIDCCKFKLYIHLYKSIYMYLKKTEEKQYMLIYSLGTCYGILRIFLCFFKIVVIIDDGC